MLEVVASVYKTMDYDKFILSEENREIELSSSIRKRQITSIKENGLLTPIIVKEIGGKYLIIDGHHRFTICKMYNIPVIFFINNNFNMFQARDCSDTTKKHNKSDIVFRGSNYGIPIYKDMEKIFEEFSDMFDTVGGSIFYLTRNFLRYKGYSGTLLENGINSKESIEKIKSIEYDYFELYDYIERVVRIVRLGKKHKIKGFILRADFIEAYRACYEHINKNFVGFIVELDNIFSSKKKADKDIVVLLSSRNRGMIIRGFEKVVLRVLNS